MVHVVCGACDSCIVQSTLPDKFKEVIDAGQDIVHEDNRIEVFVFGISEFVERDERSVPHLREVFDTMVERTTSTHRHTDRHAETHRPTQRVENTQQGLRLISRAVLIYRDVHIVVPEDGSHPEERREKVWKNVERVVQVDSEEVLVVICQSSPCRRQIVDVSP